MKKHNKNIQLASFKDVYRWLENLNATEQGPVHIIKYGERSTRPFRAHLELGKIVLRSNAQDSVQRKYDLTSTRWDAFCQFVKDNPEMSRGELADNFKQYGCTNKYFWPSIISISKQYYIN